MGHIVEKLLARRGHQQIAEKDFLARRSDPQRADFREALDARGAEKAQLGAEKLVAVERSQRLAGTVDKPFASRAFVDADRVHDIVGAANDARVPRSDDLRCARQAVRPGDQRPGEKWLDVARGNAGNRLGLEGSNPDRGRQAIARSRRRSLEGEARLAAAAVEHDDVARVDPVRIPDLIAVHPPDVGPAPGLFEKSACDSPKRIAFLHGVAIRRIIL